MRRKFFTLMGIGIVLTGAGCAQITETGKTLWGSSTRALDRARSDALERTYRCTFNDCFDAVLDLARGDIQEGPDARGPLFDVFINDRRKRHVVLMGIEGSVDTTEVGIFFSQPTLTTVTLEVASLSGSAKRAVAQAVFDALDVRFSAIK